MKPHQVNTLVLVVVAAAMLSLTKTDAWADPPCVDPFVSGKAVQLCDTTGPGGVPDGIPDFPCAATFNTQEQLTHVCIPCGDGHVDPGAGEQCDDGNTTSGDGCSATCQVEPPPVCGNGVLEAGEQCDDGNTTSGDGCSATCQIEPPIGGEGCTPGYWKQSQHFDSWPSPYIPIGPSATLFETVFGRDVPGNPTLLQALNLAGGGLNGLMRHAAAALLSAASPDVDYDLTVAQVIALFQAAFDSGNYDTTASFFAGLNEQGCPLN